MPGSGSEWLELTLFFAFIGSLLLATSCLIYSAVGWRWRVLVGCCAIACFVGLVSFDLWANSVDRFPKGDFPRGRWFYLATPALEIACIARGVVGAARSRNKSSTLRVEDGKVVGVDSQIQDSEGH